MFPRAYTVEGNAIQSGCEDIWGHKKAMWSSIHWAVKRETAHTAAEFPLTWRGCVYDAQDDADRTKKADSFHFECMNITADLDSQTGLEHIWLKLNMMYADNGGIISQSMRFQRMIKITFYKRNMTIRKKNIWKLNTASFHCTFFQFLKSPKF